MKIFSIILYVLLFVCSSPLMAQKTFKGSIVNEKGKVRKDVIIWKKNGLDRVDTDKKGEFTFGNYVETDTLEIFFSSNRHGYLPVRGLSAVRIIEGKDSFTYVDGSIRNTVAYFRPKAFERSSSVLTREQIIQLSANNIYDLLKNGFTGVNISYDNGNQKISIRGGSSFDNSNEPLFIIDGTKYENSREVESEVNVNDIDKIELIKDGAGYGAKGANGAVVITTLKR